ncbi:sensor histidine kinase [Piscinibacter sp.]|uniref:sensor histidine kinase n=1 Tax=Piscinibacter sp. TaxID=1903157 RepID=UPI002F406C65
MSPQPPIHRIVLRTGTIAMLPLLAAALWLPHTAVLLFGALLAMTVSSWTVVRLLRRDASLWAQLASQPDEAERLADRMACRETADAARTIAAALVRHAARLKQLNDDLETVSTTVSHDLRAPVQVIKGFVDALLAGQVGSVDDAARACLERVRRNAARMDELITDLLALSRLSRETLRYERFDPLTLARSTLDLIRDRYPGRSVEWLADGRVELAADRRLFRVMLQNLVDNAVKFSPDEAVCRIEVQARYERDEVVLSVSDRGVGFPAELAQRLFRPFQRLHPNDRFQGAGVGLATAARIVRLHGGTIEGRNRDGGGAVFELRMPQKPAPALLMTEDE